MEAGRDYNECLVIKFKKMPSPKGMKIAVLCDVNPELFGDEKN